MLANMIITEFLLPKKTIFLFVLLFHFLTEFPRMKLEKESRFAIEEGLPIHIDNQRSPHGTYKVVYSPEPGKYRGN